MELLCVEKQVRLPYRKGKKANISVTREHYLREDISCKAKKCCICDGLRVKDTLRLDATHYAIPDVSSLSDYLEVFEEPAITGCILLETVLTHIRSKVGRQSYRRVKSLLSSPSKNFVVFSNEHHHETFASRRKEETTQEWQERLVCAAGVWYANHLQVSDIRTTIVIVSPYPQRYSRLHPEATGGLLVLSIEDYMQCFWPTLTDTHSLLQSLMESLVLSKDSAASTGSNSTYWTDHNIQEKLKKGLLYKGRLRVNHYHPRDEAFISQAVSGSEGQISLSGNSDIFIPGTANRNRALHNDVVAVCLLPKSEWRSRSNALPSQSDGGSHRAEDTHGEVEGEREGRGDVVPTGRVVGILEREERVYVATFDESSDVHQGKTSRVLVYPYDIRIPKVRISTRQAEDLKNHRIVIHIDSWEVDSQYPSGHFVRSIGPIGDIETETAVILIEHQLATHSFSKAMLAELPSVSEGEEWRVDEREVTERGRRDLRHTHLVMSIDPKGCEDVDDTLSIRYLEDGDVELGVHIADVSHFVSPGSLTDLEARSRSTTVYLADRRHDMLPAVLSANLCSLLSGVDRYAVSVIWRLDKHFRVKDKNIDEKEVWFGRTVIQSSYKLAYETAQALYDGAEFEKILEEIPELQTSSLSRAQKKEKLEELCSAIKSLVEIARVLKKRRGGLELEGVEVRVQISDRDQTKVEELIPKQPLEMHDVIAECMIFANHWVAKKLYESYPTRALLRNHPPPTQNRFEQLLMCAGCKGFTLETHSNKALARALDKCVDPKDPDFNRVLRYLAVQAMVQAQYFSTGSLTQDSYHHYGLDLDLYTHFTSPIRRYADLVVHRQLLAAVGDVCTDSNLLPTNHQLTLMTQNMNTKRRSAQLAQIASTELFQAMYFSADVSGDVESERRRVVDAVVIGIRSNGLMVLSLRFGIRAPVYLRDKHGLVAQPNPASFSTLSDSVIFDTGSLSHSDRSVTVTYPGAQYTINILEHVTVYVSSKVSHAHGLSLSLHLLYCGPAPLHSDRDATNVDTRREVVKAVQEEAKQKTTISMVPLSKTLSTAMTAGSYCQSDPNCSLYTTIQKTRRLALQPAN